MGEYTLLKKKTDQNAQTLTQKNASSCPGQVEIQDWINIQGARTHNLKNISCQIPKHSLTAITGPSGSGKSSLAFDTLYMECSRRFLQCIQSPFSHSALNTGNPELESIEGVMPAIGIPQLPPPVRTRTTLGQVTELSPLLRILYMQAGHFHSPITGKVLGFQTPQQIIDTLLADLKSAPEHTEKWIVTSPIRLDKNITTEQWIQTLRQDGWTRLYINNKDVLIDELDPIRIDKFFKNGKRIELVIDRLMVRLPDFEKYRNRIDEAIRLGLQRGKGCIYIHSLNQNHTQTFSTVYWDPSTDEVYPTPTERTLSPFYPEGSCTTCMGLGCEECKGFGVSVLSSCFTIAGLSIADLESFSINVLYEFLEDVSIHGFSIHRDSRAWRGNTLPPNAKDDGLSPAIRQHLQPLFKRLLARNYHLESLGLSYLCIRRNLGTLSRGEVSRLRLIRHLDEELSGILFVLDEPSCGLHARDRLQLMALLQTLQQRGNTVVMVEHQVELLEKLDWLIELGPSAGKKGGELIFSGSPSSPKLPENLKQLLAGNSICQLQNLKRELIKHDIEKKQKLPENKTKKHWFELKNVSTHNLKIGQVQFPRGYISAITGVSGAGKSTLLRELSNLEESLYIDSTPIGKHPKSNVATLSGLYKTLRDLFSQTKEAKIKGLKPRDFSLSVEGGRCPHCEGEGVEWLQLPLLDPISRPCPACDGQRFGSHVLEVRWKGLHMGQILQLTLEQTLQHFSSVPVMANKLKRLCQIGLGYLCLGQSAGSLSGGESQRLKLALLLDENWAVPRIVLLDEPTSGLDHESVLNLLVLLCGLTAKGHTVVAVEHHLDFVRCCDYMVDIGPGGGGQGGKLMYMGTPDGINICKESITRKYMTVSKI